MYWNMWQNSVMKHTDVLNSNIRCIEIDNVPIFWFGGCGWIVTLDVLKWLRRNC